MIPISSDISLDIQQTWNLIVSGLVSFQGNLLLFHSLRATAVALRMKQRLKDSAHKSYFFGLSKNNMRSFLFSSEY